MQRIEKASQVNTPSVPASQTPSLLKETDTMTNSPTPSINPHAMFQVAMCWSVSDSIKPKLARFYLKRHACHTIFDRLEFPRYPTPTSLRFFTRLRTKDEGCYRVTFSGTSLRQLELDVARWKRGNMDKAMNAYYILSFRETAEGDKFVVIKRDNNNYFAPEGHI